MTFEDSKTKFGYHKTDDLRKIAHSAGDLENFKPASHQSQGYVVTFMLKIKKILAA